ncbi:MAG: OmpA family protein [Actinobacteria bacterium]|nr:OmpA family protein [Actinomycetota bacterium]
MAKSTRRKSGGESGGGHEGAGMMRWLLTYADMITLLLALFVVLFAMSTINVRKFEALEMGLKQTFDPNPGVLTGAAKLLKEPQLTQANANNMSSRVKSVAHNVQNQAGATNTVTTPGTLQLSAIAQRLQQALAKAGLANQGITVTTEKRGVVVKVLDDQVFYGTDHASLNTVGMRMVDVVGSVLQGFNNNVVVEGYADSQPITGGPYPSNYALSAMRAINVLERLVHHDSIPEARLSAQAFGSTHPAAPNTTPQNMALNRRVDIVILNSGQGRS